MEGHIHDTHSAEHGHEPHNPEHHHEFDELKFYFYILGGIMFFILIDYLSIVIYHDTEDHHDHHDHQKKKQVQEAKPEKP
jgi:hypothetical protein